ncbi:hypothetical protein I4U23_015656 [Adineta vaga]|nr:hypothetical protein I4U23_015656 [Adineta vaga]
MDADMNLIEFSSREGEQYLFSSNESIDKLFLKTMRTEIEKEILSEQTPSSDIDVHFLDFSFSREISQNIMPILSQFLGKNLKVFQEEKEEYDQLLERTDSPIIVLALSTDDNRILLEKLCSNDQSPSIYLFGSEPTTTTEKEIFFNKYHSICGMSNNPDDLAAQLAIDVAMKNHILGNQYARENNKNCAENNYDQCIEILNQLDNFSKKNVDNGH